MKLPVFKKRQRIIYAMLTAVLFIITLMIASLLLIEDVRQDGPVIIVLIAVLCIPFLIFAALLLVSGFSCVMLDENGVALYFGKIRLNKIGWASVKRVELIAFGATWIFNVMKKNKPSYSFIMGRMLENLNKKRITFAYDTQAQKIITQYYNGEIIQSKPM